MATLDLVQPGETVRVVKLVGDGAIKRRIMDMGVTKGTSIFVRKVAPLGDPVEVTIRGYELSLRKSEAEHVEVVPADASAVTPAETQALVEPPATIQTTTPAEPPAEASTN